MRIHTFVALCGVLFLGACSDSDVAPVAGSGSDTVLSGHSGKTASEILVTDQDITNRKYLAIGDITVSVSKGTVFSADPTREQINKALQEKAAKLGADAVILVHYGTVGITPFSWGTLRGSGRAIAYQ